MRVSPWQCVKNVAAGCLLVAFLAAYLVMGLVVKLAMGRTRRQ